jgi:hypothetical protein
MAVDAIKALFGHADRFNTFLQHELV